MLKPLDLYIGLKILTAAQDWSQHSLAKDLIVSSSSVNSALKELQRAKLLMVHKSQFLPIISNWEEFLISSVKYCFAIEAKELTVGIPTAYAAKPISDEIVPGDDPLPVWPHVDGGVKGIAVEPLHPSAPKVISNNQNDDFHQLLVLVDVLRLVNSRARERKLAEKYLRVKLAEIKQNFESMYEQSSKGKVYRE